MRVRFTAIVACFVLALASAAAGQTALDLSVKNRSSDLRRSLATVRFEPVQSGNAADRQRWQIEITQAKQDASEAKVYVLLGAGMVIGSMILPDGYQGLSLLATTAGLGTAGYGGYSYFRAKGRLGRLESEGRAKGFQASLGPTGVSARFTLVFD
jgi:hypothetical protein